MKLSDAQNNLIKRLSQTPDGDLLISLLEDLIINYSNMRLYKGLTLEQINARQMACDLLEEELIDRLIRARSNQEVIITKEEYE